MKGLVEFTKADLIENQLQIAGTFDKMHKITHEDQECLNKVKEDYVEKALDPLHMLWDLFEDNHLLLKEDELKEESYFKDDIFGKVKAQFDMIWEALNNLKRTTTDKEIPTLNERDELIRKQRQEFEGLHHFIRNVTIEDINTQFLIEECQYEIHSRWNPIDYGHDAIRYKFTNLLLDMPYELNFVEYKNMVQTTLSLLNYKMDVITHPLFRIIPQIGIPTWRMFDMYSEIPAFSVNSVVWSSFGGLADLVRNNKVSEGDKRQLLIRTFLTYQTNRQTTSNQEREAFDLPTGPISYSAMNEVD